jgi:hypothetical protein
MFLYSIRHAWENKTLTHILLKYPKAYLLKKSYRKAKLSPPIVIVQKQNTGTFFFAPLRASLTVEAALVLPWFLFVMITVLQYGTVMGTAVKYGSALAETGKSMAAAAYVTRYGGDTSGVPEVAAAVLSEAYAQSKVTAKSGNPKNVKNVNMLLSSFLKNEETIDLVLTYQIRSPLGVISLPGNLFLQRARVRAWTGRCAPVQGSDDEDHADSHDYVYVAQTGTVYHEDPDCTYLNPSIRSVDAGILDTIRNNSGGRYYRCEKCGVNSPSGTVYITNEGDRYHNSLDCSGLKRTVKQVDREELAQMRACSKCSK